MIEAREIGEFAIWYAVFLLSLTLHEGAHAIAARLGGDDTAYHGGQATLNPWPHIQREPLGTVVIPLVTFWISGWMMGWASTPFDPRWAARHPRRQAAMSAAGPAANLLLAAVGFVALRLLLQAGVLVPAGPRGFAGIAAAAPGTPRDSFLHPLALLLSITLSLNLLLFVFNLIPLPPLDGSGLAQGLLPLSAGRLIDRLRTTPALALAGLVVAWRIADLVLPPVFRIVIGWLYAGL
jgi:Zn-dependent protease